MSDWRQYTFGGGFKMIEIEDANRLMSNALVEKDGNTIQLDAVWDTGSSYTVVRAGLLEAFDLKKVDGLTINSVGGAVEATGYEANLVLPGGITFKNTTIYELENFENGIDMLIGMDIIKQGDFAVSCVNGRTEFSFRVPSKGINLTDDNLPND